MFIRLTLQSRVQHPEAETKNPRRPKATGVPGVRSGYCSWNVAEPTSVKPRSSEATSSTGVVVSVSS